MPHAQQGAKKDQAHVLTCPSMLLRPPFRAVAGGWGGVVHHLWREALAWGADDALQGGADGLFLSRFRSDLKDPFGHIGLAIRGLDYPVAAVILIHRG